MATITTNEIATEFETDARTLRKFLRSEASGIEQVGKGARYAIERKQLRSLKAKFAKWDEARKAPVTDEATESDMTPESDTDD